VRVLEMTDVGVRRGTSWLLSDVSWRVDEADRWVVIGPNGAGKTTALTIASTRLFPSRGSVEVLGQRMGGVDLSELRPRVGFASSALMREIPMHETAADLVMTAAYGITGRWQEHYFDEDMDRARSLLGTWGALGYADRPFASLSEGERKRVLISRALMSDPELLLLDEPGAGLDLAGREELVGMLGDFASDPHSPTLILVTHHLEEIPPGVTHSLILGNGRAIAAGPIRDTLTSGNITRAYGMNISVTSIDDRWLATAAR
jgi:iron complex transport system ATP-binding protein